MTFIELQFLLLHAKFQSHLTYGTEEKRFLKVFTIYEHGGQLGHMTRTNYINFLLAITDVQYKIQLQSIQWFLRRRCLKVWTDDGQQTIGILYATIGHLF